MFEEWNKIANKGRENYASTVPLKKWYYDAVNKEYVYVQI